jgi:HK97 family phage portal protein
MSLFRRKAAEDRTLSPETTMPLMVEGFPGDASSVAPSNALAIADVWACVRALADAASSLPLIVYRRTVSGRERIEGRTADLLRNPAPAVTQCAFVAQVMCHLNLWGNAYIGKYKDPDGKVEQLAPLRPSAVTVRIQNGQPVYWFIDPWTGERFVLGTGDVIHVKGLADNGIIGLSPVHQCRVALGLSDALTKHASTFFANDARPSGILKVPQGPAVQDQVDNLRKAWEARHGGLTNAHRIAVVAGDIDFTSVSMPMEDAQFLEQRHLSSQEVARIFRVPPWIIGAPSGDRQTYANVEQQSLHFVMHSLRPQLVAIEQALSSDTDLFTGNTYAEFLIEALLRADSATRASVYTAALNPITGWMRRDEIRELENLPPEAPAPMPAAIAGTNGHGVFNPDPQSGVNQ